MATETPPGASKRPRPWLLVVLGIAVVAVLWSRMFSGDAAPSDVPRTAAVAPQGRGPANGTKVDPSELDVKLEALSQPTRGADASERNPFRFKPPPPPPPPPPPKPVPVTPVVPQPDPGPPPPPPITIKFIGIVQTARGQVGAFIDCGDASGRNRATFAGREGETLEGKYRIVRIGIESAIVEYLDGRGRTTLPLNGQAQACLGR